MTRIAEVLVQPIDTDYIVIVNEETGEEVTIRANRAEAIADAMTALARRMETTDD